MPKRTPDRVLSKEMFVKGTNKEMSTILVFPGVYDFVTNKIIFLRSAVLGN